MITRRGLGTIIGAATVARSFPVRAAARSMRMGNAAGTVDAQVAFVTIGMHPKLGYYAAENVALEVINMSGSSQSMQALATGAVEFATINPLTFLPVVANNPRLGVTCAYEWCRSAYWEVAVKPDSPVKTIADLRGKTIGIRNNGDTGYFGARAMLTELGMDPDRDVSWISVGNGGPAGDALYRGRIDALAIWDAELARVELSGFKLRYLPNTPISDRVFGGSWGVSAAGLKADRAPYVGLFRGMAKSTIFLVNNLDLGVRMHWDLYPESKPKGISDEQAMQNTLYLLSRRAPKWFARPGAKDQRLGASSAEEWALMTQYTGTTAKIPDPGGLWTDDLIADVNSFDRDAIAAQAKAMTSI